MAAKYAPIPLKKKQTVPKRKILYVGDDTSYFENLKQRYTNTYPSPEFEFEFIVLDKFTFDKFYQLYFTLLHSRARIIYIDFYRHTAELLKIASLLTCENHFKFIPIVGLIEDFEQGHKCRLHGVKITHIKCAEYHDAVYHPFYIAWPKDVHKPDFALAKFIKDSHLICDLRIHYFCASHLRAEGNIPLPKGEEITLAHNIPKKNVPSEKFVVKNVHTHGTFYNHTYSYDLEYRFIDPPTFEDLPDPDDVIQQDEEEEGKIIDPKEISKIKKERVELYQDDLKIAKKKHREWVLNNIDGSRVPITKILFVDKKMRFLLKEEKPLDQYPYIMQCQTELPEDLNEIDRFRPDIIAIQFPSSIMSEFDAEAFENGEQDKSEDQVMLERLANILGFVREDKEYRPFVTLFNTPQYTSKSLQDTLKYQHIISNNNQLELASVITMADLYEKKHEKRRRDMIQRRLSTLRSQNPKKYRRLTLADIDEPKYYPKTLSSLAIASYKQEIKLTSMTESECTFESEVELGINNTYRFDFPVPLALTLVPEIKREGTYTPRAAQKTLAHKYCALVHTIDETRKKKVRLFVNQIFFSALNEQRKREKEEFERMQSDAQAVKAKEEQEQNEEEDVLSGKGFKQTADGSIVFTDFDDNDDENK